MQQKNIDLTTGSIPKKLFKLFLPIMGGMFLQTVFNLVDTYFVSLLGHQAIAAVSMNFPIIFMLVAFGNSVAVGTSSMVARSLGAKAQQNAERAAIQALTLALCFGIVATVVGVIFAPDILRLMGAEEELLNLSVQYTRVIFAGSLIFFIFLAFDGILRGEGDMKTSMMKQLVAVGFNIVLDPIFIFGLGPIPAMGVGGAAFATVLSRLFGLIFLVRHFYLKKSSISVNLTKLIYMAEIIKEIMAVGLPSSAAQAMMSVTLFVFNRLASGYGEEAVAALGLGFRIDSLAILPGLAIGISTLTMVGQNFGAGEFDRVRRTYLVAKGMAAGLMILLGSVLFLFPEFFIGIFTTEESVIEYGTTYLRILPIFYPFLGSGLISAHSFQGIGKAVPALLVSLIRVLFVGVPLAYILTSFTDLGPTGLWLSLGLSDFTFALVGFIWFNKTFYKITHQRIVKLH